MVTRAERFAAAGASPASPPRPRCEKKPAASAASVSPRKKPRFACSRAGRRRAMLPLKDLVKLNAGSGTGTTVRPTETPLRPRPAFRRDAQLPLSELLRVRSRGGRQVVAFRALEEKPNLQRFDSADYYSSSTLARLRFLGLQVNLDDKFRQVDDGEGRRSPHSPPCVPTVCGASDDLAAA